ncbi:PAS domain S-box protein [Polaribacter litorisediminis]|uniref:PAS domain S-box protein n=1 Tax=Polaribacter litorisediminis TaxID=1908341 RepID=UPI001CC0770E|nr:PAS domain S-box protein [Polaribacter litorisediminis]UAM98626.1 PAS domain S-box protein [Polaribacter litorisediminis]
MFNKTTKYSAQLKILHLEDTPSEAELVERELKKENLLFKILVVENKKTFEKALNTYPPDIVLINHAIPSFDSLEVMQVLKQKGLNIPVILVSTAITEKQAIAFMKAGAEDIVLKNQLYRLPKALLNSVQKNKLEQQLQESKIFNKAVLSSLNAHVVIINKDGSIIAINKASDEFTQENDEEKLTNIAKGSNYFDVCKKSILAGNPFAEQAMLGIKSVLNKKNKIFELEYPSYSFNGQRWLLLHVANFGNDAHKVIISHQDISARKQTEQEIIDYKYAINQSSIVAITDQKGIIKYANNNFCKISKYSAQELIGKDHRIINSGYHSKSFIKNLWTTIANGKIWRGELKNKAKDGTTYWVFTTIVPFLDKKGKPYQYMAIRKEITERKNAEEALLKSESNLRAIFENTSEGFILVDTKGIVKSFNPKAAQTVLLNNKQEIKIGSNLSNFIKLPSKENHKNALLKVFKGKTVEYDYCHKRKKGNSKWFNFIINPVYNKKNEIEGACFTFADITSKKEAAYQKEKMSADLIQRNQNLEQFTFMISHNLRAPNANIIGFAEILKIETLTAEEQKASLQGLLASVTRLDAIIKDINHILQNNREVHEKKETILFSRLVKDSLLNIGNRIDKHNVNIICDFIQVKEIYSLKVYMHSIFFNLISNSIKYRKPDEKPRIEIKSKKEKGKIILVFKDNGLGIDLSTKGDKIFGLYNRFHSHVEGKGMGLFMVKTQVESLGGKITIASEINKGTEFTIIFNIKSKIK